MNSEPLYDAAARLRRAVDSQDYPELETALENYRRQFDARLAAYPPRAVEAEGLVAEASELMRWALEAVRGARAQKARELESVSAIIGYRSGAGLRPMWEIKA